MMSELWILSPKEEAHHCSGQQDLLQLPDMSLDRAARRSLRYTVERERFNEEHYMADFMDDDMVRITRVRP